MIKYRNESKNIRINSIVYLFTYFDVTIKLNYFHLSYSKKVAFVFLNKILLTKAKQTKCCNSIIYTFFIKFYVNWNNLVPFSVKENEDYKYDVK